jgi:predicted secreted protein
MARLDETANGRESKFRVGELFEIVLAETRTTGFKWAIEKSGKPVCALVSESSEAPGGPPGQAGTHFWQFRAAQIGSTTIVLHSRRAWEARAEPARVFQLQVEVAE